MIVGGKEFETTIEEVPIDKLQPNLEQPRRYELQRELESKGLDPKTAKTPSGIELATRFEELMRSIVENEGISMPLLVEKIDGRYIVLEGDRRLGASRRILGDNEILDAHPLLKERLSKLPCLVVKGPLSEEDRLRLLAHIHIHLAAWRPVAKQKVIMDLRERLAQDDRVAAIMGVTTGSISKAVTVEEVSKKFAFKGPAAVSYARDLISIRKDLLDSEVIDVTAKKVKEGLIKTPVAIRGLRKVLADEDAREVFLKPGTTVEDAENVLRAKEFRKTLEGPKAIEFDELLNRLVITLKKVSFEDLVKYKGNKEIRKTIDEAMTLLSQFKTYV